MKKLVFIILLISISDFSFSQDTTDYRTITNSVTGNYMAFQFMNSGQNETYEALNTNSTIDGTIDINFPIFKQSEITTGIGWNYRFGDAYLDTNDARVNESFLRIPLNYKYYLTTSENNLIPFMGIGTYLDILCSQNYYFRDKEIPENFETSHKFGSYYKIGISMNVGFRFLMSDFIDLEVGMNTNIDLHSLFINPKNISTYDYSAFGLYISFMFK